MNAPTLSSTYVRAAGILAQVYRGSSLAQTGPLDPAVQDLCYGTLRDFAYLDALVAPLLHKPLGDAEIRALIACAVRDLQRGRVAPFTVVDEAVSAAANLGFPAAKALVNAVLRNFLRQRSSLEAAAIRDETALWRHPAWWVDELKTAFPLDWEAIVQAGNLHPPMTLRVNRRKRGADIYGARLREAGLAADPVGEDGFRLQTPMPMSQLPGFGAGDVSVQDAGAQLAAPALQAESGMRVLDACAAPGGKTAHLLERADLELLALDRDEGRLARLSDNLRRLGLAAEVRCADAAAVESWWDGRPFDRVLLDAPCTASGIVRRHPDIKWLRRREDIGSFAAQQAGLLDALWRVLAPGGKLLYVTCSMFAQENVQQVERFLARTPDATSDALPEGMPADGQLLPNAQQDGFYFALLKKNRSQSR